MNLKFLNMVGMKRRFKSLPINLKKNEVQCLHQGVAKRGFQRQFQLSSGCKVSEAIFKNGMLSIKIIDETKYEEQKKIKIKT